MPLSFKVVSEERVQHYLVNDVFKQQDNNVTLKLALLRWLRSSGGGGMVVRPCDTTSLTTLIPYYMAAACRYMYPLRLGVLEYCFVCVWRESKQGRVYVPTDLTTLLQ